MQYSLGIMSYSEVLVLAASRKWIVRIHLGFKLGYLEIQYEAVGVYQRKSHLSLQIGGFYFTR